MPTHDGPKAKHVTIGVLALIFFAHLTLFILMIASIASAHHNPDHERGNENDQPESASTTSQTFTNSTTTATTTVSSTATTTSATTTIHSDATSTDEGEEDWWYDDEYEEEEPPAYVGNDPMIYATKYNYFSNENIVVFGNGLKPIGSYFLQIVKYPHSGEQTTELMNIQADAVGNIYNVFVSKHEIGYWRVSLLDYLSEEENSVSFKVSP